jgi:hypothetical protein
MNEHPILFSTPMVTAILDARKIQTRRVVDKLYPISNPNGNWVYVGEENGGYVFKDSISSTIPLKCPYGQVGDRLWVRETFLIATDNSIIYKADNNMARHKGIWKPSIFMPRWASRITLEIIDIKPQRLQDITHEDAISEGAKYMPAAELREERMTVPQIVFAGYWDSINEKRGYGWDKNPWVWVITFKVLEVNK